MAIADGAERPTADSAVAPQEPLRVDGLMHVPIDPLGIDPFESVLKPEQMQKLRHAAEESRRLMADRVVWHVNSTDKGGGVAEMLMALLPYARGAGVDARWVVIAGDPAFFRITKRIHNHLHGQDGDSPVLTDDDRAHYDAIARARGESLLSLLDSDDFVVLHDPQTAGMAPIIAEHCAGVVWRCHVGVDSPNDRVRSAWHFLRGYVRAADALIFSRKQFVWDGLDDCRVEIVAPSIDPFSAKNRMIEPAGVSAILHASGIIRQAAAPSEQVEFERQDASRSPIIHTVDMTEAQAVSPSARIVLQVSRWDRLKDPLGVLEGFRRSVVPAVEAELILAGPSVAEVADDPEGHDVFVEVRSAWEALSDDERRHIHLACLPMDDDQENAAMVNALQRRADIVVQKSLAEGFGLTVSEAMWKSRAMVASAVGGIQDQIEDGVSGVLIPDARDLDRFGDAVLGLLQDSERAQRIGEAGHERVRDSFLGTRAMLQYAEVLLSLRS